MRKFIYLFATIVIVCSSTLTAQPVRTPAAIPAKLKVQTVPPVKTTLQLETVSLQSIDINKLTPKQFKASPLLNPITKTPTKADTQFVYQVTNNGKSTTVRINASEFYDKLNSTERGFNDLGYSVYDGEGEKPAPVLLQKMKFGANTLSTQVNMAPKSISPKPSKSQTNAQFGVQSNIVKISPNLPLATAPLKPGVLPTVINRDERKTWEFGEKSSFRAYLDVRLKSNASFYPSAAGLLAPNNTCHIHAKGEAGGSILNHDFEIVKALADFEVPPNDGDITAKATVVILGKTTTLLDERVKTSWSLEDEFKTSAQVEVPFRVPLGPISIKGALGVNGNAGVRYNVSLSRAGVSGIVTPFVNVNGYGEAGVDILIAGGGVGTSITLASAEVDLSASALLAWKSSKLHMTDDFSMTYDVHFLDGRVYAFAYVMVPRFAMPPWKEKRFEHDFFSWKGYQQNGTIFNITKDVVID